MVGCCRKQCSLKAFTLGGEDPNKFALPQAKWPLLPVSFITYRIIYALYQIIVQILLLINWGSPPFYPQRDSKAKWLIFVSNWTFLLHTSYTIWSAITASYWHLTGKSKTEVIQPTQNSNDLEMASNSMATGKEDGETTPMAPIVNTPWYFKVQWAMQNILCEAEFFVTTLYWVLEYDPGEAHFFSVNVHGVGLALVAIDFLLVANPFRYLHFVYTAIYSSVYFVFTLIYFLAGGLNPEGGTFIYSGFLDWGANPGRSAIVAVITVCVVTPLINGLYVLLYLMKLSFGKCCGCCKPDTK